MIAIRVHPYSSEALDAATSRPDAGEVKSHYLLRKRSGTRYLCDFRWRGQRDEPWGDGGRTYSTAVGSNTNGLGMERARVEKDLLIRVRYEGQGAHVRARLFTALEPDRTFALRGTLIFPVEEFHAFRETVGAFVEFVPDGFKVVPA